MIRRAALLCALALAPSAASCLGPNNAYDSLHNWNAELSEQDWVNELAYLGLHVVPAYPVFFLGDVLLFNTLGYWTGNNPIADPGEFPGFERG